MSVDLKKDKIQVVLLHPGWVKTRMGTDRAPLTADESVGNMVNLLTDSSRDINGKFFNYDGKEIAW